MKTNYSKIWREVKLQETMVIPTTYTVVHADQIAIKETTEEVVRDFLGKTDKRLSSVYATGNLDEPISGTEWLQENPLPAQS